MPGRGCFVILSGRSASDSLAVSNNQRDPLRAVFPKVWAVVLNSNRLKSDSFSLNSLMT